MQFLQPNNRLQRIVPENSAPRHPVSKRAAEFDRTGAPLQVGQANATDW
jgi:hypothetical protein